jgi:glucose-1-phosphate thymidylyltransferase
LENDIRGNIDKGSTIAGNVKVGKNSKVVGSHIRGPVIIGKNSVIKNSYIGPYTSIHDGTKVEDSEIEFSIIMENCKIKNVGIRIESSILGSNVDIIKASGIPKTHRFILGTQSMVELF